MYLRQVREARTLLVTDRGQPVAELRPVPLDASVTAKLLKPSGQRAVTLPARKGTAAFRPIQNRVVSPTVLEQMGAGRRAAHPVTRVFPGHRPGQPMDQGAVQWA